MKKRYQRLLTIYWTLLFFSVIPSVVFAQQSNIDTLIKKMNRYRTQNLPEKIYLHIDRSSYLTGETMWFKIYLTDGSLHKPSGISKVAYIEFMDRSNQSVLQTKVEIKDGTGAGSLYLPATLNSGHYMIRAYTNWMKNFNAEFYFHKPVSIVNTFKTLDAETEIRTDTYDAQFFPEGGNLIANVKSKVAFKVTDAAGNGVDFKGTLINQKNDTLTTFSPFRLGMGNFVFTPNPSSQYRAVIRSPSGKTQTVNLPVVMAVGYSLRVTDSTNNQISIAVHAKIPDNDPSIIPGVYLLVHSRASITHTAFQMLRQGSANFVINLNDLKEGISHLTIFDMNMMPVCERLYFKQPENNMSITIKANQSQYEPRRTVKVNLIASVKQAAIASTLSVSVFKTDSLPSFNTSIVNFFWLTSDLKGTIESPEYYLSTSPQAKQAVDNLMLTQGWSRFVWKDVLSNKKNTVKFIPEYRGHIVQGSVAKEDGLPAYGIMTYLSSPSKIINLYPSRSNKNGDVQFEMQHFYGSAKIIAQTNPKNDSAYGIKIKSPFSDELANRTLPYFKLSENIVRQLVNRSVAMQVQDIYFPSQPLRLTSVDSSAFYGKADETYLLDAFTRFPVMEEVMREYVPGVLVRKRRDGFHFIVLDNVNKGTFNESPLVLLDGVPVFDEDEIMSFSPLNVKKLEVMTRRWYLGQLSFNGIVSYTTYRGDLGGFPLNPKSVLLNYEGVQIQREFYSPKYENKTQRESRMPDQRYLLYWNPFVTTDKDGQQQLEFNTSDIAGEYTIIVEGITKDGNVGSAASTFAVKELNH
jgi:hypothetical protein